MEILYKQLNMNTTIPMYFRQLGTCAPLLNVTRSSDLPVITAPQKMVQKLEKLRERKENRRRATSSKPKGPLVIFCQRKSYNFRRNENFNRDTDFYKLVSCGWKNRKRNGDYFTLMPHADNPSLQHQENVVTFGDLGLNEQLCERLCHLGYHMPTQIQRLAIPPFLRGDNIICAAETGSGKTLSYLLPAVDRISQQKALIAQAKIGSLHNEDNSWGNPHTVVLSPNRELTEQVMSFTQSLTSSADITAQCVVGGSTSKSGLLRFADLPMDILVTTPGILKRMLSTKCLRKSNLQSLILDEADTLLDDSFLPDIHDIFQRYQVSLSESVGESNIPFQGGIQLSLVSATMPRDLNGAIGHVIPVESMTKVTTKGLHHLMPHVPQTFHRINPDRKPEKLIQLLKKNTEKEQVSLVFAKNSKTSFFLRNLLQDNGINCLVMNGELKVEERDGIFSQFKDGYCDIMVATDIASRGLDTTNVHHVVNYDFPCFLSDYIHRVGRVGRVGAKNAGCVTSFVSHKWDVDLLWKIEMAARMGVSLENVNANIKRKLEGLKSYSDVFTVNTFS